jgi:hypothetical protein
MPSISEIAFNQRTPITLEELRQGIAAIVSLAGCDNCGLGGVDILLRPKEIVNPEAAAGPQPVPWVATFRNQIR